MTTSWCSDRSGNKGNRRELFLRWGRRVSRIVSVITLFTIAKKNWLAHFIWFFIFFYVFCAIVGWRSAYSSFTCLVLAFNFIFRWNCGRALPLFLFCWGWRCFGRTAQVLSRNYKINRSANWKTLIIIIDLSLLTCFLSFCLCVENKKVTN